MHATPALPLRRKLAFSAVVLALAAALAEGGLRLAGALARARVEASIAAGAAPAAAGERVLICAGDSATLGFPGGPDQAWPRALGTVLAETGIAVRNVGQLGAPFEKILGRVEAQIARESGHPTAAIVLGGHNDCSHLRLRGELVRQPARALQVAHGLVARTCTGRLLTQIVVRGRRGASPAKGFGDPADLGDCGERIRVALASAQQLSARTGVPLLVIDYPVEAAWVWGPTPGPFAQTWLLDEILAREASAAGLPFRSTRRCVFEAQIADGRPFFEGAGVHMTPLGYAALGRCVAGFVPTLTWSAPPRR